MNTISTCFSAERAESLLFIAVGAIAPAVAVGCMPALRQPCFYGVALTLSEVAALQLIAGITVCQRSPHDMARVQQMLQSAPERLQSEGVPRMGVVMCNFKIYLEVEVALLTLSLVVFLLVSPGVFVRGALRSCRSPGSAGRGSGGRRVPGPAACRRGCPRGWRFP
jgi:hypothetical protein